MNKRKVILKGINYSYKMSNIDDEDFSDISEDETEIPDQKIEQEYDIVEQALKIRKKIMDYTQQNCLELCEYLSETDIIEFVEWTLQNY